MSLRNARPKIKISQLREIGWAFWDPIGLKDHREECEDEYDTYLLRAAGMIWHNAPQEEVVDYLVDIEQNYMGMPDGGSEAATMTAAQIQSYLKTVPTSAVRGEPVEPRLWSVNMVPGRPR